MAGMIAEQMRRTFEERPTVEILGHFQSGPFNLQETEQWGIVVRIEMDAFDRSYPGIFSNRALR